MDGGKLCASLAVDIRKHRIRIHKTTLNQLGPPSNIQLLVNPTDRIVAIRGTEKRSKDTHVVNLARIKPDNSYELYSKEFITMLMSLIPELNGEFTYRLTGEVHIGKKIAFFPLNTIQRVEVGL